MQPVIAGDEQLYERQIKPKAQKETSELSKAIGVKATAMIDISDGLSAQLDHICRQSKTGCRVYEEKIPIDVKTSELAEEFNMNPLTCALNGGEDYELLFTVNIGEFDKIKTLKDIHIIGHVTDAASGLFLVTNANQEFELKAQGWDAMRV